jgi:hypothetical protein
MKKRKKRQAKKTVLRPHELTHLHWGWLLMGLTVLIACVVVAAFASSRSQTSSGNATIRPVGTSVTAPPGMGRQGSQHTAGIFPLSAGGPIPVPANVLHPTNIARVLVKNVLTSIYAGSMTREPATGALAILQENLMTGQQSLHLYQTSQPVGSLTILAVQNDILTFSFAKAKGTFNLATDQFHF